MKNDVVQVSIKGVLPTSNGCALFLGDESKAFVIYIEQGIGNSIMMALNGVEKERPLTHDLLDTLCRGFQIELQRIIINDAKEGTFFARMILSMENELGKKIIELDARPSDSVTLAVLQEAPIFVSRAVFEEVEDMTEVLEKILSENNDDDPPGENPSGDNPQFPF
ncbi:MAG: bifunctional nuclease family protein [Opitutales bacterium]|nr:bifunctional nuclease family protein [Opitutales bacterium]